MDNPMIAVTDLLKYSNFGIEVKGKNYKYSDIDEIYFIYQKIKINFITTNTYYDFSIRLHDGKHISINNKLKIYTTKSKINSLNSAFIHISNKSKEFRLNNYLKQLEDHGYFQYKFSNVRIYNDGNVKKGERTVNLKKAAKSGKIYFGQQRGIPGSHYFSTNPDKLDISESSGGIFSRGNQLSFECHANRDVLFPIIKTIAYTES